MFLIFFLQFTGLFGVCTSSDPLHSKKIQKTLILAFEANSPASQKIALFGILAYYAA